LILKNMDKAKVGGNIICELVHGASRAVVCNIAWYDAIKLHGIGRHANTGPACTVHSFTPPPKADCIRPSVLPKMKAAMEFVADPYTSMGHGLAMQCKGRTAEPDRAVHLACVLELAFLCSQCDE
jgi:hypothetical protein